MRVVCSADTPLQSLFMQKLKDADDTESRILLDDLELSQVYLFFPYYNCFIFLAFILKTSQMEIGSIEVNVENW